MNDYGMRSLSEDSGNNLHHIHVESLCETLSDFLDTLEGSADFSNDELVEKDKQGRLGYKLITTADYDKTSSSNINPYKPAIACACLFADMFVYAVAQPSYIATVPFLNSAAQGVNSTYHQDHVAFHLQGFAKIQQIQEQMRQNRTLLPGYLSPFKTDTSKGKTGYLKGSAPVEASVDWVDIAKKNPAVGRHVPKRFNTD